MKLDFDIETKYPKIDFDMKDTKVISQSAKKEIVVVDIEKMISEQNVKLFIDLSRRYENGEIVIVGSMGKNMAIVNAVALWSETRVDWVATSGQWEAHTMLEGGTFNPFVTVYGIECDGEKIVIGSGSIENPDLADYVKNTDYATTSKAGIVKWAGEQYGILIQKSNGNISIAAPSTTDIDNRNGNNATNKAITLKKLDYAVKKGLTTNTETLTDDEKAAACETIGALGTPNRKGGYFIVGVGVNGEQTTYIVGNTPGNSTNHTIPWYHTNNNNILNMEPEGAGYSLYTCTPKKPMAAANKNYIDNLPDYFTPTDEQKTKWRGLIGATKLYKHSIPIPIGNGLLGLSPNANLVYYSTSNEPNYTSFTPIIPRLSEAMNGIQPRIIDDGVGVNVVVFGSIGESIFRLNADGTILQETLTSLGDDTVTEL